MRLAVEVTTCTASRTGIGYYTEHLVDGLLATRAPGDELVLLSNRAPATRLAERWAPWLRVDGGPVRAWWMQTDVPSLLVSCGADVAVFPNYIAPLASPCPAIVFVHDVALLRMPELFTLRKRVLMTPLLRQSVAVAPLVATVSEASRRELIECLGVEPARIVVLPGAAHPSCRPLAAEETAPVLARHGLRRPYVLTVGTLEPRKNLPTLLEAWDRLGAPAEGLELVVVGGRGWRDAELVNALAERRPLGRVRWLGYVSEPDLVALYAAARLFVYPSRHEGFGLPVLEAMACGAPVVASDVAALREVAGDAATFAPPGDAGALAAAMAGVLAGPNGARGAGLARARAFSWARTAEILWARAREVGPSRVRSRPVTIARPAAGEAPAGVAEPAWALLATVAYADLFDAPLPLSDARRACLGAALDEGQVKEIVSALAGRVVLQRGYLTLAGREELIARRLAGEATTRAMLEGHRRILAVLAALPFVRMLAFSGGTVHQNPGTHPDIDLFVIAAAGRAYTAYALLFLATRLSGTRKIVCPNYLVDEHEVEIAYHHDLFTAHQLVSARPISGAETYEVFCRANERWVRRFYPGFTPHEGGAMLDGRRVQRWLELALAPVAAPLERILRQAWRIHLRRRTASARRPDVVLGDGILKLHLSDYRRRVLDRFAARLAELGRPDAPVRCDSPP